MKSHRRLLSCLILVIGFFVTPARADVLKSESNLQPFADLVMQAVSKGDLPSAYAAIKRYSTLPANEIDAGAQQSINQRNAQFVARYGRTLGHELMGAKKLGSSLVRLSYIEKAEKHPLVWHFNFYRTSDGWVLDSFGWDDQIAPLFLVY